MIINLISSDVYARGGKHISKNVWDASRPADTDSNLLDVLKVDAPVNEFPTVTLAIKCTVLEREFFTMMRDHVLWARTSRVDDITQFEITTLLENQDDLYYQAIRDVMNENKKLGIAQDQYRMMAPILSMTSFTTKVNLRSLIKLIKSFEWAAKLNPRLESIFESAIVQLSTVANTMLDDNKLSEIKASIKPIMLFPEIQQFESGRIGDTVVITTKIPFALRAQVVRHRTLSIKDNISQLLVSADIEYMLFNELITVQISADISTWISIIKKRSCWIAQYDIWSSIISKAEEVCGTGVNTLPCSHGVCPYEKDAELRMTDKDPGSPCPRYALIKGVKLTLEQQIAVIKQAATENRPPYWATIINKLEIIK